MRLAVISDTHGNLPALRAVLAAIDARGPWDQIVMAGDFAMGGPFPAECIDLIRERGIPAVRGNGDEAIVVESRGPVAVWGDQEGYVAHNAQQVAVDRWALDRLSDEQIDYLAGLPLRLDIGGGDVPKLTITHATPWSPHPIVLPNAPEEVVRRMVEAAGGSTVAYGHIHRPYARLVDGRLLVGVGSVGMPFDGSPGADYAEFESTPSGWTVLLREVAYDPRPVIEAAREHDLPIANFWPTFFQAG